MTKPFRSFSALATTAALALAGCARQVVTVPQPAPGPVVAASPTTATPAPVSPAPAPVTSAPRVVPNDSTIVFERPNGMLLRTGSLVYDLSSTRAAPTPCDSHCVVVTPLGIRTVTVSETLVGGVPAWLIAESRTGTPLQTSDSLYVTRVDLAPLRWSATAGRMQLAASFTRDSLFGAMQSYQGRSSFSAPLPTGVLLTPGMVERIVELLPLGTGYRAAATLVLFELGSPRVVPAQLLVDRHDVVQVAGRAVDCWVVTLRAGAVEERLWVSKEGSRVVKTEQVVQGATVAATLR